MLTQTELDKAGHTVHDLQQELQATKAELEECHRWNDRLHSQAQELHRAIPRLMEARDLIRDENPYSKETRRLICEVLDIVGLV
jgi:uncharacterized coiled-coil DUF342 family protein